MALLGDAVQVTLRQVYLDSLEDVCKITPVTMGTLDEYGIPAKTLGTPVLVACRFRELSAQELAGMGEVPEFTAEIKIAERDVSTIDQLQLTKLWDLAITPINFEIVGVLKTRFGRTLQVKKIGG